MRKLIFTYGRKLPYIVRTDDVSNVLEKGGIIATDVCLRKTFSWLYSGPLFLFTPSSLPRLCWYLKWWDRHCFTYVRGEEVEVRQHNTAIRFQTTAKKIKAAEASFMFEYQLGSPWRESQNLVDAVFSALLQVFTSANGRGRANSKSNTLSRKCGGGLRGVDTRSSISALRILQRANCPGKSLEETTVEMSQHYGRLLDDVFTNDAVVSYQDPITADLVIAWLRRWHRCRREWSCCK